MDRTPVTLKKREEIASGTWAFTFSRGGAPFAFTPGQAVDLFLPALAHPDPRGEQRPFTIAGTAGYDGFLIATRVRGSGFKQTLLEVPLGSPAEISAPWGDFALPRTGQADIVMLAGGIGVTPFRAMAEDAVARSLPHDISLIHSNRTPEETPFLQDLRRWTTAHHRFNYLPTMTQMEKSHAPWLGERRRVDATFLDDVLDDRRAEASYMVAGPPRFVRAVHEALGAVGVPEARIQLDEFDGY
jgi:ferredoxin-NADP reductase